MNDETMQNLVTRIMEYAEVEVFIAFQGGEPTLAGIDYFYKFIDLLESKNTKHVKIYYSLQTNGTTIDEKWCELFKKYNFLIGVSLDGSKCVHDENRLFNDESGTFDRVMKSIELLRKYNIDFNILSVVNKKVATHAKEVYNFYKENNFKFIQFIPCIDEPFEATYDFSLNDKDYLNFLNDTFDLYYNDFMNGNYISIRNYDNWCMMIKGRRPESCGMMGVCASYFLVESNGNVYPCDFYAFDKWILGNINNNDFNELAHSEKAHEFIKESLYVYPKCKTCKWKNICRGGCRKYRQATGQELPGLSKFCYSYYNFFERNFHRLRQIADKAIR